MQKRKFDELVSYFNKKVSEMEIETKYKMELLGMVTALGCAHEKEMSDLSETKRESSDTISRQAAINTVSNWLRAVFGVNSNANTGVFSELLALPSAEPVRMKGKWIYGENDCQDGWFCSECRFFIPWDYDYYGLNNINFIKDFHVCPHCKTEMVTYTGKKEDTDEHSG